MEKITNWRAASLKDIVAQLEFCKFTDEIGHPLENNVAFIELKRRSDLEELDDYDPDDEANEHGIHVYEILLQSRKYKGVLYNSVGGDVKGTGILEGMNDLSDNYFAKTKSWETDLTQEQRDANERHGRYDEEGYLNEIILFDAKGDSLTIDADDADEDCDDFVVGIRILKFTPEED